MRIRIRYVLHRAETCNPILTPIAHGNRSVSFTANNKVMGIYCTHTNTSCSRRSKFSSFNFTVKIYFSLCQIAGDSCMAMDLLCLNCKYTHLQGKCNVRLSDCVVFVSVRMAVRYISSRSIDGCVDSCANLKRTKKCQRTLFYPVAK